MMNREDEFINKHKSELLNLKEFITNIVKDEVSIFVYYNRYYDYIGVYYKIDDSLENNYEVERILSDYTYFHNKSIVTCASVDSIALFKDINSNTDAKISDIILFTGTVCSTVASVTEFKNSTVSYFIPNKFEKISDIKSNSFRNSNSFGKPKSNINKIVDNISRPARYLSERKGLNLCQ